MSLILETLSIYVARFRVPFFAASQGMKLWIKVQCIFHFAGCNSAALLHRSHGQCDFPWMQAVWHGNLPIVLSGYFCSIFAIRNTCILITMFNVLQPSSPLCCFLLLFTTILFIQLPLILFTPPFHIFLIVSYLALSFVRLIIYQ